MAGRDELRRLAGRLGISTDFTDALGERHEVAEETLQALIAAFGLPADPTAAGDTLKERDRSLPFGLAPVYLVHAEDPHPELALHPPRGGGITWTCRFEDGREMSGRGSIAASGRGAMLRLPAGLPLGYHRFVVAARGTTAETDLIVAPPSCWLPPELGPDRRAWGVTCQLYGLKSARNGGIGDLTDLAALARGAGSCGAATVGINPLHALFAAEPLHVSPYSPSSRTWLDHRYIDVAAVQGFAEDESARALLAEPWYGATLWAARTGELIDYGAVAACQRRVLEALFATFRARGFDREFREFQRAGGRPLEEFATFEALHEHHWRPQANFSWHSWPAPMRDPRSPEVAEFADAHRDRVAFFQFLQWQADRLLAAAAAAGRDGGLSIGLYRDLAVGANPHGADAWADQELVAPGATIGAPPDALSRAGQNWGLAPVNPLVLRQQGFAPFVACLRANMRHAGVLRIDHVMALDRLYWIPAGMPATAGAYVGYPFDALLRLVALESRRQRCAVIGEDLGTVPEGFRERMQAANVLSYRIARFERRSDGGYMSPAQYPPLAAAAAATHDMATLKGFWLGRDIAWRRALGLYPDPQAEANEAAERDRDRRLLLDALAREGLIAPERFAEFLPAEREPVYTATLGEAILAYLARSRSRLMLVQLEDIAGEDEQANFPGTSDEHPNWRRRMHRPLEDLLAGDLRRVAALIAAERRRGPGDRGGPE
jgi:4-alpha-glucanotransferase